MSADKVPLSKKKINAHKLLKQMQDKIAHYDKLAKDNKDNVHSFTFYTSIGIALQETNTTIFNSLED